MRRFVADNVLNGDADSLLKECSLRFGCRAHLGNVLVGDADSLLEELNTRLQSVLHIELQCLRCPPHKLCTTGKSTQWKVGGDSESW